VLSLMSKIARILIALNLPYKRLAMVLIPGKITSMNASVTGIAAICLTGQSNTEMKLILNKSS